LKEQEKIWENGIFEDGFGCKKNVKTDWKSLTVTPKPFLRKRS